MNSHLYKKLLLRFQKCMMRVSLYWSYTHSTHVIQDSLVSTAISNAIVTHHVTVAQ